ncbi:FdtA/QdtA family cupin domain-containing protein [Neobacillus sp. PS3-12]|uniref:sugar 3,4-ketoisomerase n=1 Tax=Neobacillus sp. PS3-12 TaxID=3070677 RepID=UPI0027E190FF|nr:FdtA/QdtA family cupin domain-containing protein [Neobacillus sp. PS3-12]WML54784.1 FdtA/QdtA family cupin domain-containing protein [Neobacillus sp. PS3-12]
MKKYRMLEFPQLGDDRGQLVVVEQLKNIPFDLKRIFYLYGTKGDVARGQHANRFSQFVLINLNGTCKVLVDDGEHSEVICLDKPHTGIYLDKLVWKEMFDFSSDSILLVLSSELYDKSEYIDSYDQFLKEVNNQRIISER